MSAPPSSRARVVLDGLVEGPVPPFPDGDERLRAWVTLARSVKLDFDLSIEGAGFSLLAERTPIAPGEFEDFTETVRQALEQLLSLFPRELRGRVFSTVRSTEERADKRVQAVYIVTPKGIDARVRTLDPEKPPDGGAARPRVSRIAVIIPAAAALIAIVLTLSLVDVKGVWNAVVNRFVALSADDVEVDGAALSRYATLTKVGVDATGRRLVIEMARSAAFPKDLAAYRAEEARVLAEGTLRDLRTLHDMVLGGVVEVTYKNTRGEAVGVELMNVRALQEKEKITLFLRIKDHVGATRVVVR